MTWTKLEAKGDLPSPRWGHTLTPVGKRLILFGGETIGGQKLSEVYVLDTDTLTWTKAGPTGVMVAPRKNHSAALVAAKQKIIYFGGDDVKDPNNLLVVLDTENMVWTSPPCQGEVPTPRKGQVCVLHTNKFLVYSGWSNVGPLFEYLDDMSMYNLGTLSWSKVPKKGPFPTPRGGACGSILGNHFFVFGGIGSVKEYYNEIHYMDLTNMTWLKKKPVGTIPAERFYHCSTPIKDNQLLIFGGQTSPKEYTNELWILDTSSIY
jgi:N-acetylneuraminic acid mutarotase